MSTAVCPHSHTVQVDLFDDDQLIRLYEIVIQEDGIEIHPIAQTAFFYLKFIRIILEHIAGNLFSGNIIKAYFTHIIQVHGIIQNHGSWVGIRIQFKEAGLNEGGICFHAPPVIATDVGKLHYLLPYTHQ